MIRKLAYWLVGTLAGLSFSLLLLVSWLLFTSSGGQWVLGQLPSLKVSGFQGQLASQWQAKRVQWQGEGIALDLQNLAFSWQASCLFDRKICINNLQLASLKITTPTSQPATSSLPLNLQSLRLPEIHLPQLNLFELTQLNGLEISQLALERLDLNGQEQLSHLQLSATWQTTQLSIQHLEVQSPWLTQVLQENQHNTAKVQLEGRLTTEKNWPLSLNLTSELSEYPLQLALTGDLAKLQIQTNLNLSRKEQKAAISLEGWVNLLKTTAPLDLTLAWHNLYPSQTHPELVVGLEDLQLDKGELTLAGNLQTGWQLVANAQQRINFQPVNLSLTSNLSWQKLVVEKLKLSLDEKRWLAVDFTLNANEPEQFSLDGKLAGQLKSEPSPSVELASSFSGFVNTASLKTEAANYQFNLTDLFITTDQEKLALALSLDSKTWQAETEIKLDDLASLTKILVKTFKPNQAEDLLANYPLAGDLKLNAKLALPAPSLDKKISSQALLSQVSQGDYQLQLASKALGYATSQLINTDFSFNYQGEKKPLNHKTALDPQINLAFSSQELILEKNKQNPSAKVLIEAIKVNLAGLVSDHQLTTTLVLDKQPLHASIQGGVEITDTNIMEWQYQLAALSTELMKPWLPADLRWTDQITGEMQGSWQNEQLKTSLELHSGPGELAIKLEDTLNKTFTWVPLTYHLLNLGLRLEDEELITYLTLDGDQLGYLNTQVTMNLKPDATSQQRPIKGHYQLEGLQVQAFSPFVDLDQLTGLVRGQGEIRGHLLAPELWGNLQLQEVVAVNSRWPITLKRLDGQLLLQGEQLSLEANFATGEGGDGQLTGELFWQPELTARLNLKGDAFQVRIEPWASLQVTPDLTFSYQQETLLLAGKVKVPSGLISVQQLPKQAVRVSEDAQVVGREAVIKKGPRLNLDLELLLGNGQESEKPPLSLAAFGLNAEIQGRLRVGNDLQTRGELLLVKGTYQSWGQDLKLRKARLNFAGPISQPFLNIEAVREVQDVTVGIHMTGRVDRPEATIFSEPSMANEQALSWLILGRPLKTEKDENTLNAAAISYGLKQASGVTERLGESLGLKDFQLVAEGGGSEASVVASGYINDRLSVGYGVGVYDEVSRFVVRYELSRQVYIEAASALASSLDIFWRLDF